MSARDVPGWGRYDPERVLEGARCALRAARSGDAAACEKHGTAAAKLAGPRGIMGDRLWAASRAAVAQQDREEHLADLCNRLADQTGRQKAESEEA